MATFRSVGEGCIFPPSNTVPDMTLWYHSAGSRTSHLDRTFTDKTYADNSQVTYTYNPGGPLATRTWARGVVTSYTYDPGDRLIQISYSDATPSVSFSYDRMGRPLSATVDGMAQSTYEYNVLGMLLSETQNGSVIDRHYDTLGRSTGYTLGAPASPPAQEVFYAYDQYGRFASVGASVPASPNTPQEDMTFEYSYLPGTRLVSGMTSSTGHYWVRGYEPHRNLISVVENGFDNSVISSFVYTNDEIGRRVTRNNDDFSYNDRNEIVAANLESANYQLPTTNFSYDYDAIGNRITAEHDAHVTEYLANDLNQYTAISATSEPPREPTYDLDGNMTFDGVEWHYIWNGENRLVYAYNATNIVNYAYDHAGRMIYKTISHTNTAPHKTIAYTWDDFNIIAEAIATSEGVETTYNIWGLNIDGLLQGAGGVGGLLAVINTTEGTFIPAYDANGNITEYADTLGAIRASREYDPFGGTTIEAGDSEAFSHWFSTKPFCSITGLYEYQFRMYCPEVGRWLNRDLIEENGGVLLFGFCGNNPVLLVDFYGFKYDAIKAAIIAAAQWLSLGSDIAQNYPLPPTDLTPPASAPATPLPPSTLPKPPAGASPPAGAAPAAGASASSWSIAGVASAVALGVGVAQLGVDAMDALGLLNDKEPDWTVVRHSPAQPCSGGYELMDVWQSRRISYGYFKETVFGFVNANRVFWVKKQIDIVFECVCLPLSDWHVEPWEIVRTPIDEAWMWGIVARGKGEKIDMRQRMWRNPTK